MFRIAAAQINTCVGDLCGNAERVLAFARKAAEARADLVVFPELTLSGYPPEDLFFLHGFVEENLRVLERVAREAPPIPMVVGYLDRARNGGVHDSAALIRGGEIVLRYHKSILPNYAVFDEERYFVRGAT